MSEQTLQEHVGPCLYFPATVQLASFSPSRHVAKTTKIKKPTEVIAGYVKHPRYPTTKACPTDSNVPLLEGRETAGSTQPERQSQGTAPVTLLLAPLPSPLTLYTQNADYIYLLSRRALHFSFSLQTQR